MAEALSQAMAGFGVGVALASAPGPVQAVLLSEATRGGLRRGFRAMAGANLTFGAVLLALALGLSVAPPGGLGLRLLKVTGGALLLWLGYDGFRSAGEIDLSSAARRSLPPAARGALAVIFNPGGWIFVATVASSLLSGAARAGGTGSAVLVALTLLVGLAIGDGSVVLLGGIGIRRAGARVGMWIGRGLAILLAGLGLWLLIDGLVE